jgi:hypothetical protein
MNEQNDEEQREQRAKDAAEQPELTPSQNEQPGPARPAGWRQTRFLRTENVCSQWAPRGVSNTQTPLLPLLFLDVGSQFVVAIRTA